jgi:hypothetical protein
MINPLANDGPNSRLVDPKDVSSKKIDRVVNME